MESRQPPLNRGKQLLALRKLKLRPLGDVRPGVAKSVLRCIDDHGKQCWASVATIAAESQFSVRSVFRALSHLVAEGFVFEEKRLGQTTRLTINWDHAHLCQSDMGSEIKPMPESHRPMPESHGGMPESHRPMPESHPKRKETRTSEKKRKPSSSLRIDQGDSVFAESMYSKILQVAPKTKMPDKRAWANEVRLMREKDGHSITEIREVFEWANSDEFWKTNILSPKKLREKFAVLHAKMKSTSKSKVNIGPGQKFDDSRKDKNAKF